MIPEISLMVDIFKSAFGNNLVIIGFLSIFVFLMLVQFMNMHILYAFLLVVTPVIIASISGLLNIYWILAIYIIIAALLLTRATVELFSK